MHMHVNTLVSMSMSLYKNMNIAKQIIYLQSGLLYDKSSLKRVSHPVKLYILNCERCVLAHKPVLYLLCGSG